MNKRQHSAAISKKSLIAYTNPDSVISDQFRTIRANLTFLTERGENHVFLITSPGMKEGKSTTTANLAVCMAQQKKERVLLIDAHLKEPSIHSIFDIPNEAGLTNMLRYDVKLEEVVYKTELETLDILTSGVKSFNPAELLGNEIMTEVLKKAANIYDIVLIDSPSLQCSETRILANQCDGVVLVLRRDKTERKQAIEAGRVLELAHAKLVGAIMNEA
ncbi:CpsD/CapB family tyrosine-protein kinase [Domibacillus mangrovi]|uniref:CpsD/CapB family tyrosine-protein kinase n=1 Tax=Domibacillus mangrovi TaxID=1714354 RepID=UPI000AFBF4D1|nr:CpsD/CapB family tyrosine-protein kinase [Domibacillus mangrovi]